MNKIKDEFFRYISFCRSCRYFKNNSDGLVMTDMGFAKYFAAWLLLVLLAVVSLFTNSTELPDGKIVTISVLHTNWYMWLAAFMLIVAIAARGIQGRLTPMSHRRRTAYYLLRPILISVIVCICAVVIFCIVAVIITAVQSFIFQPLYSFGPAAKLWLSSAILYFLSAALFVPAVRGANKKFAAVAAVLLLFYYVLSFLTFNLSDYRPQNGFEFFANPIISLEYLPQWQGWLFAGIMAAAAVIMCAFAIIFTYRECKPKNF